MAEFEGEKSLNRETSELEVKGKFKLSEEELGNVAGGCGPDNYNGYQPVDASWAPCDYMKSISPDLYNCHECQYFKYLPDEVRKDYGVCGYCTHVG